MIEASHATDDTLDSQVSTAIGGQAGQLAEVAAEVAAGGWQGELRAPASYQPKVRACVAKS
jgi:hypothetical protein